MAVKFKPWTPYGTPPPDRYDPGLDAQVAAGERGYGDLLVDNATANRRDLEDFQFGQSDFDTQGVRGHEDIQTQRETLNRNAGRNLADLDTTQGRNQQDYNRNVSLLQRSFAQLGNRQGQQARVMGVAGGGALLAAARKRAENQGIERQPLDTAFNRSNEDINLQRGRIGEDQATALGQLGRSDIRLDQDIDTGRTRLNTGLSKNVADRTTMGERGAREQTFLEADTVKARHAQAVQTNWDPGPEPKNEFTNAATGSRRVITRGNTVYVIDPHGNVISQRPKRVR